MKHTLSRKTAASRPRVPANEPVYRSLLSGVAAVVETRDPAAGDHLKRLRTYCRAMTEELRCEPRFSRKLSRRFCDLLVEASTLHDVGKAAIPDRILLKPARLNTREMRTMRRHTLAGHRMLSRVIAEHGPHPLLALARDIALCHHERWDGSGYPNGLSGEQIPLAARIVAVADVYDALTSRRCYKDALPERLARRSIANEAGRHFDPAVVKAFLRWKSRRSDQKRDV